MSICSEMICQVPACQVDVNDGHILCDQHWRKLPTSVKDNVYRWAWKKGKGHEGAEEGYAQAVKDAVARAKEQG